MREVITYKADDGAEFKDKATCLTYETLCLRADVLVKSWSKSYKNKDYWTKERGSVGEVINLVVWKSTWEEFVKDILREFLTVCHPELLGPYKEGIEYLLGAPGEGFEDYMKEYDALFTPAWQWNMVDPKTGIEYALPVYWKDPKINKIIHGEKDRGDI